MGIPVKRYKRHKIIGDTTSPIYNYLRREPGSYKTVTIRKIAKRIERGGAMTAEDVEHVIKAFVHELRGELVEGNRVKVDELGIFHTTFTIEGTEEEKDCTVKKIKRVNVKFSVDKSLRLVNDSTATTRGGDNNVQFYIKSDASTASTDPGNSGGDDDDDYVDPNA